MTGLNATTVKGLLSALAADRHPDAAQTARGRHAALVALSSAVGAVADAIPALDTAICPAEHERDRTRHDRRWHTVLADTDKAARDTEYLQAALDSAANSCARMITQGEPVTYHGSLTAQHGDYILDGNCPCNEEHDNCAGLALARRGRGIVLTCVNTHSISPAEFTDTSGLHTACSIKPALVGTIQTLSQPVDTDHAVTLVRSLASITGHLGDVASTWSEPIRQQIIVAWLLDTDGRAAWRHRQSVTRTLETAGGAAAAIRTTLRHAAGVLADISDNPQTAAAA